MYYDAYPALAERVVHCGRQVAAITQQFDLVAFAYNSQPVVGVVFFDCCRGGLLDNRGEDTVNPLLQHVAAVARDQEAVVIIQSRSLKTSP